MLLNYLEEVLLVLLYVNERAIFLEPLLTSGAVVTDGYGLCTVEDDGHVLIELRQVVDWLSVELFLVEQEEGEEGLNGLHFGDQWDFLVPFREVYSPLGVRSVAKIDEVTGCQSKGQLEGLPLFQICLDRGEPHTVERMQPTQNFCQFLCNGLSCRFYPQLCLDLHLGLF